MTEQRNCVKLQNTNLNEPKLQGMIYLKMLAIVSEKRK